MIVVKKKLIYLKIITKGSDKVYFLDYDRDFLYYYYGGYKPQGYYSPCAGWIFSKDLKQFVQNLIQQNKGTQKETILATRMAGFKEPIYEYLGLKLLSYSVYENPFEILETPLQNPISNIGYNAYARFGLFVFN